ncbi:hypothetical protein SAMN02745824_1690 [Parasphingorhabdus marina DSM 22363]|uniref:Uncharacterized protein n=1 Tax=Parasphingorhabdus marina DSM 22363 TaxID=1123272 RepID=A0A1N6D8R9_9SPHN|nr:hypothetical protein SAMN02745824_1690 [Parasphingorhabdus marina DSM 22363]
MSFKKGSTTSRFTAPEMRIWLSLAILGFSQATWGLEKGLGAIIVFLASDFLLIRIPIKRRTNLRLVTRSIALCLAFIVPVLINIAIGNWNSYQCGKSDSCQFLIVEENL